MPAEAVVSDVEAVQGKDVTLPQRWWLTVVHGRKCVMCGTKRNVEGHHIIERQVLRREHPKGADIGCEHFTLYELIWAASNGLPVCELCHVRHTRALARIPAEKLPIQAIWFARALGLEHKVGPRYYPTSNPKEHHVLHPR
jgi:hypothetical protein